MYEGGSDTVTLTVLRTLLEKQEGTEEELTAFAASRCYVKKASAV